MLVTATDSRRTPWRTGIRLRGRRLLASPTAGLLLTCALAMLTVVLLLGPGLLLGLNRAVVGLNPAKDFQIMTWSLKWWPWALSHGVNPLHTTLL